jgi:hypothetical protein
MTPRAAPLPTAIAISELLLLLLPPPLVGGILPHEGFPKLGYVLQFVVGTDALPRRRSSVRTRSMTRPVVPIVPTRHIIVISSRKLPLLSRLLLLMMRLKGRWRSGGKWGVWTLSIPPLPGRSRRRRRRRRRRGGGRCEFRPRRRWRRSRGGGAPRRRIGSSPSSRVGSRIGPRAGRRRFLRITVVVR